MQILAPNTTPQTMTIIPRSYDVDSIVITDEDENKSYTIASGDITNTTDRYYLNVAVNFPNNTFGDSILKEGRFYTIDFLLGTDKVYRDNVFVLHKVLMIIQLIRINMMNTNQLMNI